MNGKERKEKSEIFLREHGILVNKNLPVIESEEEADFRQPEEIAERAAAAVFASQTAIDIANGNDIAASREFFMEHINRLGLYEKLTSYEKIIFEAETVPQDFAVNMTWRIEMCMPLFYSCGFTAGDLEYPSDVSDCTDIVRMLINCKDHEDMISHIKMRPKSDILDRADLIYRMDWACVESRLRKSKPVSADLSHDVVVEQHKGYNWIIGAYGSEDWDDVSADT